MAWRSFRAQTVRGWDYELGSHWRFGSKTTTPRNHYTCRSHTVCFASSLLLVQRYLFTYGISANIIDSHQRSYTNNHDLRAPTVARTIELHNNKWQVRICQAFFPLNEDTGQSYIACGGQSRPLPPEADGGFTVSRGLRLRRNIRRCKVNIGRLKPAYRQALRTKPTSRVRIIPPTVPVTGLSLNGTYFDA